MISQLTKAFTDLNGDVFETTLPEQEQVDFETNLNRKCIFHFVEPNVIEIGIGFLNANREEILDDLVHVMVHMHNFRKGIVDQTANQYHNRYFVQKALSIGLTVRHHAARGWSLTSSDNSPVTGIEKIRYPVSDAANNLRTCLQKIFFSDLELDNFKSALNRDIEAKPQKEYLLKYICDCVPPVIIRSGRRPDGQNPLDIRCNQCKTNFVLENERPS